MYRLLRLQCLFAAAVFPVWAINITVPAEGDVYTRDPGSSAIEWQQERYVTQTIN